MQYVFVAHVLPTVRFALRARVVVASYWSLEKWKTIWQVVVELLLVFVVLPFSYFFLVCILIVGGRNLRGPHVQIKPCTALCILVHS